MRNIAIALIDPQSNGSWTKTELYSFTGGSDGSQPIAGLVMDGLGNLYGTTYYGGRGVQNCNCGVVFKLSPNGNAAWKESAIFAFNGGTGGAYPWAPVLFDSEGNLYGTTAYGGSSDGGVAFELKPSASGLWTESTLHQFQGGATDGSLPLSGISFDSEGNLYGTTNAGGLANCSYYAPLQRCGTLYKLAPNSTGEWNESIVHLFGSSTIDGIYPTSGVYINPSGTLFGMTSGGPGNNAFGGTLFEIIQ